MPGMNVIAIDIGTTHCKAVVINEAGKVLKAFQSATKPIEPKAGWNEQDADEIFNAVLKLLQQSFIFCKGNIACVSFSAAMHSLLAVDIYGKPLMNMITWADLRSAKHAHELKRNAVSKKIYEATAVPIHAMSPLCKLIWLRNEVPGIFSKTHKFISIKEYIFFRLFGKYIVDHSIAAATGLFDQRNLYWYSAALKVAGINARHLSEILPVNHYETALVPAIKKQLRAENAIPFVLGGSDGALANLGCGAIHAKEAAVTIGTSGAVRLVTNKYANDKKQRLFCYYLSNEMYLTGGAVNNGGNVLKWFAEKILKEDIKTEKQFQSLLRAGIQISPGAEGLLFLPYIMGERSPMWDENARGAFIGLTSTHTRAHLTKAVLEGICFGLLDVMHAVEETSGKIKNIYLSGGVIKSAEWVEGYRVRW